MKIKNNKSNIMNLGGELILMPGVNPTVDAGAWDKVKNLPLVKAMLRDDVLEVETGSFENLSALTSKKAISMIKETAIVEDLERWLTTERNSKDVRKDVIEAINKQLAALRPDRKGQ